MARLTAGQVAAYARGAGLSGDGLATAVAVAGFAGSPHPGESGGDPRAHNPRGRDDSYGLWQINMYGTLGPARRRQFGLSSNAQLYDPATNARAMAAISSGGTNFRPWSVYTSGAYRANLPAARAAVAGVTGTGVAGAARGSTSTPAYRLDYEPAGSTCTGRATPGAEALMSAAVAKYANRGARSLGIYNCRKVAGTNTTSLHSEGRALDVGFPGVGNAYGTALAADLTAAARQLGIQQIIWNRRVWRPSTGWRPYNGSSPHTDHLHIELTRAAAVGLTRQSAAYVLTGAGNPTRGRMTQEEWDALTPAEQEAYINAQLEGSISNATGFAEEYVPGVGVISDLAGGLQNVAGVLASFFGIITSGSTWVRIAQVMLGGGLLLLGTSIAARDLGMSSPLGAVAKLNPAA